MTVILASQSPRRRELLGQMGFTDFIIRPARGEEVIDPDLSPDKLVEELSRQKAAEAAATSSPKDLIIAADTVVAIDGTVLNLSPKEYELLFYMVRNRGIALTRERLISEVWGYDFFGDDRTIDTHVKNLRNCLGPYRKFIVTLRGVGYKFEYDS